jgi:putative SOS response-associated peptidase YedK
MQQFLPGVEPSAAIEGVPRFNIAPTQSVVCVLQPDVGQPRALRWLNWGLVPSWATDPAIGNRMINARGETVAVKPSFRSAFRQRRCLVLADGYYEWQKLEGGKKQPMLIEPRDGRPFAMAGLWERNTKIDSSQPLETCTIITTAAVGSLSEIHDRTPAVLEEPVFDRWLDPAFRDLDALQQMLQPANETRFAARPVSTRVNNPRHDDASCLLSE